MYIIMLVIYCYLESGCNEVLKFHMNSFCYFEISARSFKSCSQKSASP